MPGQALQLRETASSRSSSRCACGRERPRDHHESTLAEAACAHPVQYSDGTRLPGIDLRRHSSEIPSPQWAAEILTRPPGACHLLPSVQLTPKALFHLALSRSDHLDRPHGVRSSECNLAIIGDDRERSKQLVGTVGNGSCRTHWTRLATVLEHVSSDQAPCDAK